MDEFSALYKELSGLIALISLITQRPPDLREDPDGDFVPDSLFLEKSGSSDDEEDEQVNEAEFEVEIAAGDPDASLDGLKRNALDRLAEVLARYKTTGTRKKAKGLDARHVASVALMEDSNNKRMVIFCSKNEGLDDTDEKFLGKLADSLKSILGEGEIQEDHIESVFDIVLDHQTPRVETYSEILRDAFKSATRVTSQNTLTREIFEQQSQLLCQSREWEDNHGLRFKFLPSGNGDDPVSDETINSLSNQEDNVAIAQTSDEIKTIFGNTGPVSLYLDQMKNLLRSVYTIVRHPRQRPVLKCFLQRALHGNDKVFGKAWDALLFLTRTFHAAVTLVDLTSKLRNMTSIEFVAVPASMFAAKTWPELKEMTPLETLAVLGCLPQTEDWIRFFREKETTKKHMKLLRMERTVHAEVQMMYYLKTHPEISPARAFTSEVFSYIGCSKKCCFFCEVFRVFHGGFSARGTHETVFPRWALPQVLEKPETLSWSVPLMRGFSISLKEILRMLLRMPCSLPKRDLLRQSSAALSTAKALQPEKVSYSERPLTMTKLLFPGAVSVSDKQVQFVPLSQEPGYAILLAPGIHGDERRLPIDRAEVYKINHDRANLSLEKMEDEDMARLNDQDFLLCRYCHKPASSRCSACRTPYCSRDCQKRNWSTHVFTCRTPDRPNPAEYLRLSVRRAKRTIMSEDREKINDVLFELLADDDLCRMFGFNSASTLDEIAQLVCLYDTVISWCHSPVKLLHTCLKAGEIAQFLVLFCQLHINQSEERSDFDPMHWFLNRQAAYPFPIPDLDKAAYEISVTAFAGALRALDLTEKVINGLNTAQYEVFELFVTIQPSVGRLPGIHSSSWQNFGFCYCKSFQQRKELADIYLKLALSNTTFDDIVSAYETSTMADLVTANGIDFSSLTHHGIRFEKPPPCQNSAFRLMVGVEHALSGRFCECFRRREDRSHYQAHETHFDLECDVGYGFHLSHTWERWQLLNFYKYIFKLPVFDPLKLAEAKKDQQRGSLERYLNALVPNMRQRIFDKNLVGSVLFPNLDGRITATATDGEEISYLPCVFPDHDVIGPPGIQWRRWAV